MDQRARQVDGAEEIERVLRHDARLRIAPDAGALGCPLVRVLAVDRRPRSVLVAHQHLAASPLRAVLGHAIGDPRPVLGQDAGLDDGLHRVPGVLALGVDPEAGRVGRRLRARRRPRARGRRRRAEDGRTVLLGRAAHGDVADVGLENGELQPYAEDELLPERNAQLGPALPAGDHEIGARLATGKKRRGREREEKDGSDHVRTGSGDVFGRSAMTRRRRRRASASW